MSRIVLRLLQHAKTHCKTLQHIATENICLFRIVFCLPSTLQHTETHCNTLQHTATQCNREDLPVSNRIPPPNAHTDSPARSLRVQQSVEILKSQLATSCIKYNDCEQDFGELHCKLRKTPLNTPRPRIYIKIPQVSSMKSTTKLSRFLIDHPRSTVILRR